MSEYYYQISEASRLLAVEAHVLRYWEEELGMEIPRNEMGHRYYTEDHIKIFSQIKDLKEQGYQLRAIRAILSGEEPPHAEAPEGIFQKPISENREKSEKNLLQPEKKSMNRAEEENRGERLIHKDNVVLKPVPVQSYREETGSGLIKNGKTTVPAASIHNSWEVPETAQIHNLWEKAEVAPGRDPRKSSVPAAAKPMQTQETEKEQPDKQEIITQEERMNQFQAMMTHIVAQAMLCNNAGLADSISKRLEHEVVSQVQEMFQISEDRQEARFHKLDESMRIIQQNNRARYEAAAAKGKGFFKRRRAKKNFRRI